MTSGAKGGLFDRAGIDISGIQKVIAPTAHVLASARNAGVKIIYLKIGFRPDLSDLGAPDSVNWVRHLRFGVGQSVRAPDGSASRLLIRDTLNTDIVPELTPQAPTWFGPTMTGLFVNDPRPVVAGNTTVIALPVSLDNAPVVDVLKPIT